MRYCLGVNFLIKNLMINFIVMREELKECCPDVENIKERIYNGSF